MTKCSRYQSYITCSRPNRSGSGLEDVLPLQRSFSHRFHYGECHLLERLKSLYDLCILDPLSTPARFTGCHIDFWKTSRQFPLTFFWIFISRFWWNCGSSGRQSLPLLVCNWRKKTRSELISRKCPFELGKVIIVRIYFFVYCGFHIFLHLQTPGLCGSVRANNPSNGHDDMLRSEWPAWREMWCHKTIMTSLQSISLTTASWSHSRRLMWRTGTVWGVLTNGGQYWARKMMIDLSHASISVTMLLLHDTV